MEFTGEAICLGTALLWAVAVSMFRGPVVAYGARSVNLAKCTLGAILQGLTVLALGQAGALFGASSGAVWALVISGVVGLTVGDTALFSAVARLGVHRTLLLQTLSPVFAAVIALVWRDELPTAVQMAGAAVILAGVAVVVAPGRARPASTPLLAGVLLGSLAAFCQGAGVVLAKAGMAEMPVVAASFLRLAAAAVGLFVLAAALRQFGRFGRLVVAPMMIKRVVPATLLGTYLALFLMMLGIALAPAAIAATLLSVSPIYGLFIDAFVHKRRVTLRGLAGTMIAVCGVAILTHG